MDLQAVDIVIYHGNCTDGFGAAYSAWKSLGNRVEYFKGLYGQPPPDVTGKNVVIVDFSYDRETILQMIQDANELILLDHHKSAMIALHDIPQARFDLTKSGAILSWEFFHPGKEPPKFIKYIQDRDLWQFKLPYSREFSAAFDMVPFDFQEFDAFCDDSVFDDAIKRGSFILAHRRVYINKIINNAGKRKLQGHDALVVNASHWISEIGEALSSHTDIAVIWYYDHKIREHTISLRTTSPNVDVSDIAKKFGGGGHPKAAGMRLRENQSIEELFDIEE